LYRKIECRIWADRKFLKWKPKTKIVFFYLLTGRHTHQIPGVIVGYQEEIATAIKHANAIEDATYDDIADAIEDIIRDGCLMVCEMAPLMYLRNALKHNKPVSPGQVKSWAKSFKEVPDSPLKNIIYRDVSAILSGMSSGMSDAFADAMPDTETEAETETEVIRRKKPTRKRARKANPKKRERAIAEKKVAEATSIIVIAHLSAKTGKDFHPTKTDIKRFQELVHEGHTKDQMIAVVDWACSSWGAEWQDRITPKSLFRIEKFRDHWQAARTKGHRKETMPELKPI